MGPSHFNSPCPGLIRISPTPCFQTFNSSPAKPLRLPVPVFSMQPYLGRALSLMTASPWRLSWSSVAKKWWRESGALPPSSTWGRQERGMEGWGTGVACGDQLAPGPLRWEADLCRRGTRCQSQAKLSAPPQDALGYLGAVSLLIWWHFIWWWIWW